MSACHRDYANPSAPAPEASLAERARTLVYQQNVGSLATLSCQHPNWPFGSVMPYGVDAQGQPTFLISTLAIHTQNLLQDARASLLVTPQEAEIDPLNAPRATLMGRATPVAQEAHQEVRQAYLARHPDAELWVDFGDFSFYRLDVIDAYFVGGFGVMGWVSADDYSHAAVDPLADFAASILQHMNADHSDALVLMARHFAACEAQSARMTMVDRFGFQLHVTRADASQVLRLPFPREVHTANDVRKVLTEMTRQARSAMQV